MRVHCSFNPEYFRGSFLKKGILFDNQDTTMQIIRATLACDCCLILSPGSSSVSYPSDVIYSEWTQLRTKYCTQLSSFPFSLSYFFVIFFNLFMLNVFSAFYVIFYYIFWEYSCFTMWWLVSTVQHNQIC